MSEWRETPLGSITTKVGSGATPRGGKGAYVSAGISLIRSMNVLDGRFDSTNLAHITDEQADRLANVVVEQDDILLNITGASVARCCLVPAYVLPARVNQHVAIVRLDRSAAVPRFVQGYLVSPQGKGRLLALAQGGATREALTKATIEGFSVPLPKLSVQKRIAEILGAIDHLIENNRRRIAVLEQMAQEIYREWFVRLRYPGHEEDELIDSPLGPLPQGWRAVPLSGVASIVMGHSPKSEHYNDAREGLPFHQGVANFGARYPHHRLYCRIDGRIAEANDHLVSVRAPVGRINRSDQRIVIGRGLAAVRSKAGLQSLLGHELRRVFREEDAMGGGTIFKAITKGDLEGIPIIQPTAKIGRRAEEILATHDEMIRVLTFGSRALASLRDLLLPKLVSGTIDVSRLDLDAVLDAA